MPCVGLDGNSAALSPFQGLMVAGGRSVNFDATFTSEERGETPLPRELRAERGIAPLTVGSSIH